MSEAPDENVPAEDPYKDNPPTEDFEEVNDL